MRIIKFRAWDKDKKQMLPVADISFGDDGSARTIIFQTSPKGRYYHGLVDGENGSLMQFTGLLDTHGKEIYEGDVLRIAFPEYASKENAIGWVVWDTSEGAWRVQSFSWWCSLSQPEQSEREIIGNIYETPELVAQH